jgi:hypothetical protein
MASSYPVRSFAYGEVSKAFAGRSDASFYHQSCRLMENFLPLSYGPAEKRPGTIYVGTSTAATVFDRGDCESAIAPMVAGETTAYLFGAGTLWARDNAQAHGGTYSYKGTKASGVSSCRIYFTDNALNSDLHGFIPGQEYTQSLWVYVPTGGPTVTFYFSDFSDGTLDYTTIGASATRDSWQQLTITRTIRPNATAARTHLLLEGAAASTLVVYVDDITLTTYASDRIVLHDWRLSATSGMVLAFGHGYIHFYKDGAVIGAPYSVATTYTLSELSSIRIKQVTSYAYITCPGHKVAKLTRTDDDNWTLADVTFTVSGGTQDFSSDYPSFVELYEDRLVLAKTPLKLGTFYGSKTATYETYTQGVTATDAWEKTPQAKQNNEIMWIVAGDAFLFGTTAGIYRVGGKESMLNPDVAWWPNIQANTGTSDVPALMVDDFVAYVGKGGRHIYRFQYSAATDQYMAEPITQLFEHKAKHIIGIVHQRNPESILWAWTSDGTLLAGCYSRSAGTIGWSPQYLGGDGIVESACVIPTNVEDQVWLSVARTVGGATVRHIEYLAAREWDLLEDSHGVDAAVVVDNGIGKTVTEISQANPAVCTATLHGFSNDDKVRFAGVAGITAVNGVVYTVENKTDNTFQLYNEADSAAIDFSTQVNVGSGGTVEKVSKVVTGLTHIEGWPVVTWGDGAEVTVQGFLEKVVASGTVTLDTYCNKIRTGLPFIAALEPMPVSEERNRLKQVKKVFLTLQKTADIQVGRDSTHMVDVKFTHPDALYTDGADEESEAKNVVDHFSRRDATIRIGSSGPGPCKITSLIYELGEVEK